MENNEEKKNKKLPILIIVTIISICIIGYIILSNKNKLDNLENNSNNSGNNISEKVEPKEEFIYQYKKFKYKKTQNLDITFSDNFDYEYGDDTFIINGNGWYGIVRIYVDKKSGIIKHPEIYKSFFEKYNIDVEDPKVNNVNGSTVITYNNNTNSSVIAEFTMNNPYGYEVEIFNDDLSFNIHMLSDVVKVLKNVTIDDTYNGNDIDDYRHINEDRFPNE